MNYILLGGYLVNEGKTFKATLYIKDGFIEKILPAGTDNANGPALEEPGYRTVDLHGAYVLPGVIDDQVHFRTPGLTHKGDLESESRAAVLGGVTSFMDMPNTVPQTLSQALLEEKYELASQHSMANYSFYMGCSQSNLNEVLQTDPARVCGIKVFLGSSTGNMLVEDPAYLETLFKNSPCLIAAHCEEESVIRAATEQYRLQYGHDVPFSVHPEIRSRKACFSSSHKAAALAQKHNTRLHILHISTLQELNLLQERITGEICVHYLWFSDRDYDNLGWRIKCNPAIKTPQDREALRAAVKQGRAVVATDHAPHTLQEKQKSYFNCPSGAPWVQHSLPMMLELVHQNIFTIEEVVQAMCHKPAQLFGIDRRGFLRPGYYADLAIVEPEKTFTVNAQNIAYKCGWSALENQTLHGSVTATFVNGTLVQQNGRILAPLHRGHRLLFQ